MAEKKPNKPVYVEPLSYFPKEIRDKYFNDDPPKKKKPQPKKGNESKEEK